VEAATGKTGQCTDFLGCKTFETRCHLGAIVAPPRRGIAIASWLLALGVVASSHPIPRALRRDLQPAATGRAVPSGSRIITVPFQVLTSDPRHRWEWDTNACHQFARSGQDFHSRSPWPDFLLWRRRHCQLLTQTNSGNKPQPDVIRTNFSPAHLALTRRQGGGHSVGKSGSQLFQAGQYLLFIDAVPRASAALRRLAGSHVASHLTVQRAPLGSAAPFSIPHLPTFHFSFSRSGHHEKPTLVTDTSNSNHSIAEVIRPNLHRSHCFCRSRRQPNRSTASVVVLDIETPSPSAPTDPSVFPRQNGKPGSAPIRRELEPRVAKPLPAAAQAMPRAFVTLTYTASRGLRHISANRPATEHCDIYEAAPLRPGLTTTTPDRRVFAPSGL
jgi:hypothetical protein